MGEPVVPATAGMTKLLRFIIDHCSFLFAPSGYRFVDSWTSESFGGDAYLVLESKSLRLRFVIDRDELMLGFQAAEDKGDSTWFSVDLLQRLITGVRQESGLLDRKKAKFLDEFIDEIEDRFTSDQLSETKRRLHELESIRAKEIFG